MDKRIVIMAGGTGGHIFPALAVAQYLQKQNWQVTWVGTHKGMESRIVPENNIEIDYLSVNGLRGKGKLAKIKMPIMLIKSCLEARAVLKKRQPDVVLGMGGFVAGPGGLVAKLLGIPLVIHEQNRVPGTTNRLLAKVATKVLQAFPDSFSGDKQAIFTGNPLREAFLQEAKEVVEKTSHAPLHLLVIGGSLGAQQLNQVMPETAKLLAAVEVRHQTGSKMQSEVEKNYQEKQVQATVTAFIDDVAEAYRWADVVICRAGAMTVSEVAAMGVPSVLVPYPYAIDDHQTANAQYLSDAGAAIIIQQNKLEIGFLAETIKEVIKNKAVMANAAKQSAKLDATQQVANYCIEVAK
ncbi:MAG: undecaprenyldiphospho-muramoylpentapeptide beta-N-acetylglucosaminyltransferase [Methyloprofundus sp.]|nr:undecaprenyldiphospho-muramoylpentapeptide beta-N-acetylglucosaminyltransferase [Methyloprofundus sp.]